ncbi:PKD domain-containing protein [Euzebyella saccharophila]|uniref:PKD domain-containing protein n=1 Tax=Euzebyella saccharophila TaxID=679664 RepID=A0ABV8JY85_9FLAO|nr:PKD domain-containing protein [Euzebyella saccharophila]
MNFYPTKVNRSFLVTVFVFLVLILSCSKDSDFLKDAILDPNTPTVSSEEVDSEDEEVVEEEEVLEEEEGVVEEEAEKVPTEIRTTIFTPIHDAHLQSGKGYNDHLIRLEENHRESYLMFDLSQIDSIGGSLAETHLEFTIATDDGHGTISVHKAVEGSWTEEDLSDTTAPQVDSLLGATTNDYRVGQTEEIILKEDKLDPGLITLVLKHEDGDDVAFASKEHPSQKGPRLVVVYEAPQDAEAIVGDEMETIEVTDQDREEENPETDTPNQEEEPDSSGEENTPETNEGENPETNTPTQEEEPDSSVEENTPETNEEENPETDTPVQEEEQTEDETAAPPVSNDNEAPKAIAEADVTKGNAPLKVTFNGENSSDDIAVVSYAWDFADGNSSKEKNPVHTFEKAGEHKVRLTVKDEQGASNTQTLTITVTEEEKSAPVAKIKASTTSGTAPLKVNFSSAESSDKDDDIASYAWNFGNGKTSTSESTSTTFDKAGTYEVALTVKDKAGLTGKATLKITVEEEENEAPKASVSADKTSGEVPLEVQFKGSNSSDDKEIDSYAWDFKDGSKSSGSNPKYTFTKAGTYQVSLTVKDEEGLSDSSSITITVKEKQNEAPVARVSATPTSGEAPLDVQFKGSNSSDDDDITSYSWDFKDGSTATSVNPSHTFNDPGTYKVSLTVKDSDGVTDTETITIEVSQKSSGGGSNTGNYPSNAVFASDFGFNSSDATDAIYSALTSGSSYVVIDKQSSDWIVKPLKLFRLSNMTIVFEQGVTLRAKSGAFSSSSSILFQLVSPENITIEGNGATLRMNKSEYNSMENRHALSIHSGNDVTVKNLTLRDSGGDGIYIAGGNSSNYSKDITIDGVVCDNNRRQGMTIISAENVYVRNSTFKGSSGADPESGVDLEPNNSDERLVNINFDNCKFTENDSHGVLISTGKLKSSSKPISISIKNSEFSNNVKSPSGGVSTTDLFVTQGLTTNPVKGSVNFQNVKFSNIRYKAIMIKKAAEAFKVSFSSCSAYNISRNGNDPGIYLEAYSGENSTGNLAFDNFYMEYSKNVPFMKVNAPNSGHILRDISGSFRINEPNNNPLEYSGGYSSNSNSNVNIKVSYVD